MLSRIRISNFKSIVDTELNLSYTDKKAPNGYKKSEQIYFLEPTSNTKDRLAAIMCLYGANASGKSNIVKVMLALGVILREGLGSRSITEFKPFHNKVNFSNTGSIVDIFFYANSKEFNYLLEFTAEKIIYEKLVCNGNTLFEIKDSKIVDISIQSEVNDKEFLERLLFESLNQDNQINTFLMTVYKRLPNLNNDLSDAVNYRDKFVQLGSNSINPAFALEYLAKSREDGKLKEALDKIANVIQKLDIDIERFEFNRRKPNQNEIVAHNIGYLSFNYEEVELYEIITIHKDINGNDVSFKLQEESAGTQFLFSIIAVIISVLENGGVIMIDELDKSLHPSITKVILEMFKSKEYNKDNSQLITTLHTTDILGHYLRTYEVGFVNKSFKKGTTVSRLSKYETRQDLNFRDRYMFGMYRAKPNTQI